LPGKDVHATIRTGRGYIADEPFRLEQFADQSGEGVSLEPFSESPTNLIASDLAKVDRGISDLLRLDHRRWIYGTSAVRACGQRGS